MEKKSNGFSVFLVVLLLIFILGSCADSGSSRNSYMDTLESGQQKYYTGQKMTKEEYNAVKGFNEWKSKQGGKTYSEWGG